MRRFSFLALALALAGCAPKPAAPRVVVLPEGLRPTPRAEGATHQEAVPDPPSKAPPPKPASAPPRPTVARTPPIPPRRSVAPTPHAAMTAPAPPRLPPADERHALGYRIPEGAVELEGVCRFGEDAVACWDGQGKNLPDLAAQIKDALTPKENDPYRGNLTMRFGRKNRIVVVRQEQATNYGPGAVRKSLFVQSMGDDPQGGFSGSIYLPSESPGFDGHKPYVTHEARVVAFAREARETKMRVQVSETMPDPPPIELRKGATASFGGCRFAVESVEKGTPRGGPYYAGLSPQDLWTVVVSIRGKPARPATFGAQAAETLYQDAKGQIVDRKAYEDGMRNAQGAGGFDFSKSPYKPVQVNGNAMRPGTLTITLNADPARVKKARLYGAFLRSVDVTGIPLDPR